MQSIIPRGVIRLWRHRRSVLLWDLGLVGTLDDKRFLVVGQRRPLTDDGPLIFGHTSRASDGPNAVRCVKQAGRRV